MFIEKNNFEKKKHEKLTRMQRVYELAQISND